MWEELKPMIEMIERFWRDGTFSDQDVVKKVAKLVDDYVVANPPEK